MPLTPATARRGVSGQGALEAPGLTQEQQRAFAVPPRRGGGNLRRPDLARVARALSPPLPSALSAAVDTRAAPRRGRPAILGCNKHRAPDVRRGLAPSLPCPARAISLQVTSEESAETEKTVAAFEEWLNATEAAQAALEGSEVPVLTRDAVSAKTRPVVDALMRLHRRPKPTPTPAPKPAKDNSTNSSSSGGSSNSGSSSSGGGGGGSGGASSEEEGEDGDEDSDGDAGDGAGEGEAAAEGAAEEGAGEAETAAGESAGASDGGEL